MKAFWMIYIFVLLFFGGVLITLAPPGLSLILLIVLFFPRIIIPRLPSLREHKKGIGGFILFTDFLMLWIMIRWILIMEIFLYQNTLIEHTLLVFLIIFWSGLFSLLNSKNPEITDTPDKYLYYLVWFANLYLRVTSDYFLPGTFYLYWQINYAQISRLFLIPIFAVALIKSIFYLVFSREEPS